MLKENDIQDTGSARAANSHKKKELPCGKIQVQEKSIQFSPASVLAMKFFFGSIASPPSFFLLFCGQDDSLSIGE